MSTVLTQIENKKIQTGFSWADALAEAIIYFGGDELAATTWLNKYAMRDSDGSFLECTPEEMHRRLAKEFARIERKYPNSKSRNLSAYGNLRKPLDEEAIFGLFDKFRYVIPQGRP